MPYRYIPLPPENRPRRSVRLPQVSWRFWFLAVVVIALWVVFSVWLASIVGICLAVYLYNRCPRHRRCHCRTQRSQGVDPLRPYRED